MNMTGQRLLHATQQQAWDSLNDPLVLRACIPGCDRFEATGPNAYEVAMLVKVGPVSARFAGGVTLSDLKPPQSYRLAFEGQGGVAGFGKGESRVQLTPAGATSELGYEVSAAVGGKLAQLGQRLVDASARAMADDFFRRFETQLQARYAAPETAAPTPAPSAQDVEADHTVRVPPRAARGRWLVAAVLVALAVAAVCVGLAARGT